MRFTGILLLTALLLALPSNASAWGPYNRLDPEFCDTATVRGNPAQLRSLPKLHEAPASARLPFAPDTVSFKAFDQFQVGDGEIGFTLSQREGRRSAPLGFRLIATFARIDRRAHTTSLLKVETLRIGSIKGYETIPLSIDVTEPGLYRARITIIDSSDGAMGRFGAYVRLLPLAVRPPRLALNAKSFAPGQHLLARVENFSTDTVTYGVPYSIERWDGSTWTAAPESPGGPWIMPLYGSRPGGTGPCLPFEVPETTEPGTYRMVKPIRTAQGAQRLFAKFEVRSPD